MTEIRRKPREFRYHTVGTDTGSKAVFKVECYRCGATGTVEGPRFPDEVVRKKLSQRGWYLGRRRDADVCPTCMGVRAENKLASSFKVTSDGAPVPSIEEVVGEATRTKESLNREILTLFNKPSKPPETIVTEQRTPEPSEPTATSLLVQLIREVGDLRLDVQRLLTSNSNLSAAVELLLEREATPPIPEPQPQPVITSSRTLESKPPKTKTERISVPLEDVGNFSHHADKHKSYFRIQRDFFIARIGEVHSVIVEARGDRIIFRKSAYPGAYASLHEVKVVVNQRSAVVHTTIPGFVGAIGKPGVKIDVVPHADGFDLVTSDRT